MSLYTSLMSVYMTLSIPLNAWMILRCMRMSDHQVKHVLLASFAAGNLFQSTVGQGLQIATSEGTSQLAICSWAQFSTWFTAVGSMIHFACLSYEHSLLSSNSNVLELLLQKRFFLPPLLWTYSAFWCIMPLIGWNNYLKFGIFYPGCEVVGIGSWKAADLVHLVFLVFLGVMVPLGVIVICQMMSYRTQNLCNITSIISLTYGDKKLYKRHKQLQQLNLTCVAMIAVWFLVWVPYLSCVLYFVVTQKEVKLFDPVAPLIRELSVLLPPLVYCYWYIHYQSTIPAWIVEKRDAWRGTTTDSPPKDQAGNLVAKRNLEENSV